MSTTKANLITLINAQITAVITQAKHRLSMLEIVNTLFPTSDTYIVTTGGVQYNLTFTKVGNKCTLSGSIANSANSIIGGVKLFDIPNSIYFPKKSVFLFGQTQFTSQNISLVISDGSFIFPNSFYLDGALPVFGILAINITYIVND
jgi:hypothetical protein